MVMVGCYRLHKQCSLAPADTVSISEFSISASTSGGAILTAVIMAMAFAVPVGYIATRVKKHHFLLVTVILSVLVTATLSSGHWRWIAGPYVTRSLDFVPVLPLGFETLSFIHGTVTYYFTVTMVVLAFAFSWSLVRSPFGHALAAIREN